MNPNNIHEDADLIPGLTEWIGYPALLWLWHRLAAVAPIQPLAWEVPYATGVALKSEKKKKRIPTFPGVQKLWVLNMIPFPFEVPIAAS